MSWIDRINNDLEIETGDGAIYVPSWVNALMVDEFHVSQFTFPNVAGTLVKRRESIGRKFSLEIVFQGEFHLDSAERFRISTYNKKYWKLRHPFYDGEILVHPTKLRYDNSDLNTTRITGLIIETITGLYPNAESSNQDKITNQKAELDEVVALNFEESTLDIQPLEITAIEADLDELEESTSKLMELQEDLNELKNKINSARRAVTNIIDGVANAMRQIQAAINYPFQVIASVRSSINNLKEQFNKLVNSVTNILGLSKNERVYIESMGANTVSTACLATISQIESNPFLSRSEVQEITEIVLDFYNTFIEAVDSIQTETQTEVDSYSPNHDVIMGVQDIVFLTVSKLAEIALDSQIENIFVNDEDNNPINLAHRFYGLDENDENLDRFIKTNKIGMNEMLMIRKGRELVYYI